MGPWEGFSGINRGYVLELYERFRQDPASVDPATRAIFEQWTPPPETAATPAAPDGVPLRTAVNAVHLAQSIEEQQPGADHRMFELGIHKLERREPADFEQPPPLARLRQFGFTIVCRRRLRLTRQHLGHRHELIPPAT